MTESDLSRIQDIPRIQSLVEQVRLLKLCKQAFPFFKPILKLLGVATEQMEVALAEIATLEKKVEMLAGLPDRFNCLFASHGWIAYDLFNVDVALSAVEKAEQGNIDEAEMDLVEYYDEKNVRWHLQTMQAVKAFHPHFSLVEKALEDYLQGRYHASIPVVLIQLDGFVNDFGNYGFFTDGADLQAWDSIAAHSTGLETLAKVLGKMRKKTTTEEISVPYRHGILHGRDLGYDNKIVAAKTWAALFAVREWAYKVEHKEVKEPPQQPSSIWREVFRTLQENNVFQSQLNAWRPRSLQIDLDMPASGEPEVYENGTPEQKLAEYLSYWQKRNYGKMAQCLAVSTLQLHKSVNACAGDLREYYNLYTLKSFTFLEVYDATPVVTTIQAQLFTERYDLDKEQVVEYRLLFESEKGKAVVRGAPEGRWGVFGLY